MIVLAIDTATPQVSVAVAGPEGVLGSFAAAAGRRHAETLAPAISLLCDATGVRLTSVERVAVDVGPGLFTGLRVGLSTAAALGTSLGCRVVGVSSLDLLAEAHTVDSSDADGAPVAAVVDARRGEVFWALFRPGRGRVREPEVASPEALAELLCALGEPVVAVGDGAARYESVLRAKVGRHLSVRGAHPSASTLALLASRPDRPTADPAALRPLYLRQADVRIGWEEREPQQPAGVS